MNKNTIIAVSVGLLIGVGGTIGVTELTQDGSVAETNNAQSSQVTNHSTMSMADMNKELESLSGDDYDKAFVEMMIAHHEGAVDMAKLSDTRAKHDEVKELSKAIISAQEKEIADMKQWQSNWGYGSDEANQMMHGGH